MDRGFFYLHSLAEWIIIATSLLVILFVVKTRLHAAIVEIITWTGLSVSALIHQDYPIAVVWFLLAPTSAALLLVDWGYHYDRVRYLIASRRASKATREAEGQQQ